MELSVVNVSFIKEGTAGREFAKFKMLAIELPPEGRSININGISGQVSMVKQDISNDTAEVWIDND